jgi:enoyl-CoA hydratase
MSETEINLDIDGAVATACLSTEGGLNVLSSGLLDKIGQAVQHVRAAKDVRIFRLTATGKVFIAGANIKELIQLDSAGAAALAHKGHRVFAAIAELPCISIARIHGAALGGGFEIAMACDFRVAISSAKVGLPETSLGLIPGWNGIGRMLALAGPSATKRLVFSAGMIDASEASRLGLVDAVAENEAELDAKIQQMIKQFQRGAPNGVAMAKQALRTGDEVKAFADCFAHPDAKEGMGAFVEKRSASWMEG